MSTNLSLKETKTEWHGTLKAYFIGFFVSLFLTSLSFGLVATDWISGHTLAYTIIALGITQAIIQLIFFLHIGQEEKPKWESIALCFTIMVLLIIIIGSLWIMHDLDERMMTDMPGMTHEKT